MCRDSYKLSEFLEFFRPLVLLSPILSSVFVRVLFFFPAFSLFFPRAHATPPVIQLSDFFLVGHVSFIAPLPFPASRYCFLSHDAVFFPCSCTLCLFPRLLNFADPWLVFSSAFSPRFMSPLLSCSSFYLTFKTNFRRSDFCVFPPPPNINTSTRLPLLTCWFKLLACPLTLR